MSERVPSFGNEYAAILLLDAKQGHGLNALNIADLLTEKSIKMSNSKRFMKDLVGFEAVTSSITRKLMKHNGFDEDLVSDEIAKKGGCCTPYVKFLTERPRKQIEVFGKMILRSVQSGKLLCQELFPQV